MSDGLSGKVVDRARSTVPGLLVPRRTTRPAGYGPQQYLLVALFAVGVWLFSTFFVQTDIGGYLLNQWLLLSIAALGFYLIFCVAGRFAFCQTLMMAAGAYTAAYMSKSHGLWVSMAVCVLAIVVLAGIFGFLVRKATAFYFSVATLALGQLGTTVFINWTSFTGPNGLRTNVPLPSIFGQTLRTQKDMTPLFLGAIVLALLVVVLIEGSPLMREAIAAREMPELAATSGISLERVQWVMFVLGSTFGAVSGGLIAYWQGSVGVDAFGLPLAIGIFLMPIIGGSNSMWGPVAGALLYVELPHQLQGSTQLAPLLYGVALVVAIILLPDGIIGGLGRLFSLFRSMALRRPRTVANAED